MPLTRAALIASLRPPPSDALLAVPAPPAADPPSPPTAEVEPASRAAASAQSTTFQLGQPLQAGNVEAGGCVNLRDAPGLEGQILRCLPGGTALSVTGRPEQADGYQWWNVDAGGWIAEPYLAVAPGGAVNQASVGRSNPPAGALADTARAHAPLRGYTGWATYYGIEDGFVRGDIMYDGTPYNPGDPTMTAASFLIPLHTWLLVCAAVNCIVVQVRDRGLLDENDVLLDLSRAAYARLFGGLGGKRQVSALLIDPSIVTLVPELGRIGVGTGSTATAGSPP